MTADEIQGVVTDAVQGHLHDRSELTHEAINGVSARVYVNSLIRPMIDEIVGALLSAQIRQHNLQVNTPYTRKEDMSPTGTLSLLMERDGDIIVEVHGEDCLERKMKRAQIQFCTSGGRSPRVLRSLIGVMEAIEAENRERPI